MFPPGTINITAPRVVHRNDESNDNIRFTNRLRFASVDFNDCDDSSCYCCVRQAARPLPPMTLLRFPTSEDDAMAATTFHQHDLMRRLRKSRKFARRLYGL